MVRRIRLPLTVSVRESGYGFIAALSPELADALANATSVQFQADVGSMIGQPHVYPLTGFNLARDAVRRCVQR